MINKKALITGISGQDALYLARHLLMEGYLISGTTRNLTSNKINKLSEMSIKEDIKIFSLDLIDKSKLEGILKQEKFDEIYHLASQSSVGESFMNPTDSIQSSFNTTLNLLEAIKKFAPESKLYHAASSECFGSFKSEINESTPFNPASPYGVGKAAAANLLKIYRDSYNLYLVNGFLFNHESPFRSEKFVTQKIVSAAFRIANGSKEKLTLGDLNITRDWGWAPEYVCAMKLMLNNKHASDFVIGTGKSYKLEEFVRLAFEYFDLNYKDYIEKAKFQFRPNDIKENYCCPKKANDQLGWKAKYSMPDVVKKLCEYKFKGKLN